MIGEFGFNTKPTSNNNRLLCLASCPKVRKDRIGTGPLFSSRISLFGTVETGPLFSAIREIFCISYISLRFFWPKFIHFPFPLRHSSFPLSSRISVPSQCNSRNSAYAILNSHVSFCLPTLKKLKFGQFYFCAFSGSFAFLLSYLDQAYPGHACSMLIHFGSGFLISFRCLKERNDSDSDSGARRSANDLNSTRNSTTLFKW